MRVLLVEDNSRDARLIREMLAEDRPSRFELEHVERLSAGLERLAGGKTDLLLLDLSLPESQGLESLRRAQAAAPGVPIVALAGPDDGPLAIEAVREGAQDCLAKGKLGPEGLARAMRYAVERKRSELALRESEESLRQMQAQFLQAQKMEAIGRLAGGLAHDFSNLLGIILGYGTVLLDYLSEDDPLRAHVDEILRAAKRATDLTRQLMAVSRKQAMETKAVDLNTLVTGMSKMLRPMIGEDIEVLLALGAGLGPVAADPGQIEQVILNLAVNARDAMPEGGKLTVETANAELDESDARRPPEVQPGSYVKLAVRDTGCGMDAETRARIFEPFFTTKEQGKGTGLGLATVFGIVHQSCGCITVDSEPGKGTTFQVFLPQAPQEAPPVSERPQARAPLGASKTILLAEDEEALRRLTCAWLVGGGYQVLEADDGQKAIEILKHHPQPIHLLLADLTMPQMDGRELASQAGVLRPGIKVLLMSDRADEMMAENRTFDSQTMLLQKPFCYKDLADKVHEVLERS